MNFVDWVSVTDVVPVVKVELPWSELIVTDWLNVSQACAETVTLPAMTPVRLPFLVLTTDALVPPSTLTSPLIAPVLVSDATPPVTLAIERKLLVVLSLQAWVFALVQLDEMTLPRLPLMLTAE